MGFVVRPVCVCGGRRKSRSGGWASSLPQGPGRRAAPEKPGQARTRPRRLRTQPGPAGRASGRPLTFFLAAASLFCLLSSAISAPGPGHVNPAGGARRSGWAGPRLLPPPGQLRHAATAHARRGLPLGQWAGGRRGGSRLGSRRVRLLLCAGAAGWRMRPSPVRL